MGESPYLDNAIGSFEEAEICGHFGYLLLHSFNIIIDTDIHAFIAMMDRS